ncbi:carbonic anhydrase [Corynebacterium renale]|uniref:carbonic anhydrase n=1 Tax=Corynebacterium renale TaxID=1724 RepID=UPI000E03B30C|nr:carbonic anhydrase [Corynebacterium renale]STC99259.1 beta-type carbonic anhydrase-like protein [Corynebacterium renale]
MAFSSVTPQNPQGVWDVLKAGNARFAQERAEHPHSDIARRVQLSSGQAPRAVVLSCSDSRVPVELVFDVGLGDIFVVRTAGHILDMAVLGSLEFAIDGLGVDLVVVMGHESCGAVAATVAALDGGDIPDGLQRTLVEKAAPSVLVSRRNGSADTASAERTHVEETIDQLYQRLPSLRSKIEDGRCGLVGLRYLLDDGHVEVLDTHGVK